MQLLTRIPTPQIADFAPDDLSRAAVWFPFVGLVVGAAVALALVAGAIIDPWLGALAGLLVWVGITGALHLDGLSDMADALGAAHHDTARFLGVLKDPHTGTFGVVVIVIAIVAKLVLLARVEPWSIALICAWARLGTLAWAVWLPALAAGSGERFQWRLHPRHIAVWTVALLAASAWLAPPLLVAPVVIAAYGLWLKRRWGGMTGDCLGAGVEIVEIVLLAVAIVLPLRGYW